MNHGCVGYKLFIKAFPNHFKYNSVYAHYPLTIPSENRKILKDLGTYDLFDFERPTYIPPRVPILSYTSLQTILNDAQTFKVPWGGMFDYLMQDEFMLSRDNPINKQMKDFVGNCIYGQQQWKDEVIKFYDSKALEMIRKKSYKIGDGYMVDAVRE